MILTKGSPYLYHDYLTVWYEGMRDGYAEFESANGVEVRIVYERVDKELKSIY